MDSEASAPDLHRVELNFAARTYDTFILSLPGLKQDAELEQRRLELIRRGFRVVQFGPRLLFMQESRGPV
ncbi:MAG: hypothetical protein SFV17_19615 [Candidatus Obscuribacter sp.]|nr:hypothetical protein [Candidatus Melainabacteria bacterium]MDX1988903.1 hypothetical protein [Candidatus Obscuribacter sp.]